MPLQTGSSQEAISANIAQLIGEGYGREQAAAIAYSTARDGESSARMRDINGFFQIDANPISKVGVFQYLGARIPGAPNPDAMYNVYRSAEELGDPECVESFKLLPWIVGHAMIGGATGIAPEQKGVGGVIGERVRFDEGTGYLLGNIKCFSETHENLIDNGENELSCGYRCMFEYAPGVFQGQPYEYVQRKIRGNHLASVDNGRCGSDVAVLDSLTITCDAKDFVTMADPEDNGAPSPTPTPAPADTSIADIKASLEQLKPLLELLPVLQQLAATAQAAAAPAPSPAPAPATEPGAAEDEDPEKLAAAMDAQEEAFLARNARRINLAEALSHHVGTFDYSAMTEKKIVAYGLEKLGIKATAGAEAATLEGWLQARPAPTAKQPAMAFDAGDKPGVNPLAAMFDKE